jgi:hypothetical protein
MSPRRIQSQLEALKQLARLRAEVGERVGGQADTLVTDLRTERAEALGRVLRSDAWSCIDPDVL